MSRTNFLDRLRDTYKYFRGGNRPIQYQKSPYLWPFGFAGKPQWSMTDYDTYYTEGFASNAVIYAAIMVKVRALTQTDLVAASGTVRQPEILEDDSDHPLKLLLDRPNAYMSGSEFNQLQSVYLNITGNSFTLLERKRDNDLPVAMWPVNPVNVQIVPDDNGEIKGFIYSPHGRLSNDSVPILPQDMIHVKLPNPLDPLQGLGFGLSPLSSLAKSADVDNNITDFIKMFFQHGGMPTGALKLKDMTLDEDSIAEIKERWMEVYGGFNNWSDIAVLDMTMEYEKIGMSFKEMDFGQIDQRNESRMLLPFGVPAELMPIRLGLEGATFANKEEARKWFWQDTMMYELDLFADSYRAYLTTDDGIFPLYDLSNVSALKQNINTQVTAAKELWAMGVPASEAFKTVGLQVADYDGSDLSYLPFNLMPSGDNNPNISQDNPNSDNASSTDDSQINQSEDKNSSFLEQKSFNWSDEQKQFFYKQFDDTTRSYETPFGVAAENALKTDKENILSIVNSHKKKSLESKASVFFPAIMSDIEDYLDSAATNWRNEFLPVMTELLEDTGIFWAAQLGVQFNIRNIEGEEWYTNYTNVFANPITDNSNEIIHDIISQAMAEGWSIDEMSNVLGDTYDVWLTGKIDPVDFDWLTRPAARPGLGNRLLHWRKEMIARTETTRIANNGSMELFKRWGVTHKQWLSTGDDRTRNSHVVMSGQTVKISEPFKSGLGNELMYPGDVKAPLADTVQCRCTLLPEIYTINQ